MTALAEPAEVDVPDSPLLVEPPVGGVRMPAETRNRYSLVCLAAVAASVVGLLPGIPSWLSAVTLGLFIGISPGCALLAWVRRPPPVSRLFLVPALGLAAIITLSAVAATVGWWAPHALYAMLALGCVWSVIPNLAGLVRDMAP